MICLYCPTVCPGTRLPLLGSSRIPASSTVPGKRTYKAAETGAAMRDDKNRRSPRSSCQKGSCSSAGSAFCRKAGTAASQFYFRAVWLRKIRSA